MAIITPTNGGQPIRMKQDEAPAEAQGWRLVSIEPRAATFVGPQGEKRMELRTFDGKGGAAPTNPAPPPEINMDVPADATGAPRRRPCRHRRAVDQRERGRSKPVRRSRTPR